MIEKTNLKMEIHEESGKVVETYEIGDLTVMSFPMNCSPAYAFWIKSEPFLALDSSLPDSQQEEIITYFIETGAFPAFKDIAI